MKFKQYYEELLNENQEYKLPKYLYHSTLKAFLPSIKQHGIVPGGKECKLFDWCSSEFVYLAPTKELAESFISLSSIEIDDESKFGQLENLFASGGVTLRIDTTRLDQSLFELDPNWNDSDGTECFVYKSIVPYSAVISFKSFIPD